MNAKALSTYMGHASVSITFDLYGHLMPGNESEAADLLDAYLARSAAPARQSRDIATGNTGGERGREGLDAPGLERDSRLAATP